MLEKKVMMSPIRDQKLNFSVFDKLEVNTMTPYRNQSYMITSKEAPWSTEGVGHALRLKE
jgi:glutamine synthetase